MEKHKGYTERITFLDINNRENIKMAILTKEEIKILKLIADGASDETIADSIGRSRGSIRIAIKSMFRVTNTENRYALIAWGFRNNCLK